MLLEKQNVIRKTKPNPLSPLLTVDLPPWTNSEAFPHQLLTSELFIIVQMAMIYSAFKCNCSAQILFDKCIINCERT